MAEETTTAPYSPSSPTTATLRPDTASLVLLDEGSIDPGFTQFVDERCREDVAAHPAQHDGRGAVTAGGDRLVAALAAADERDRLADQGLVRGRKTRRGDDDIHVEGANDDDPTRHSPVP